MLIFAPGIRYLISINNINKAIMSKKALLLICDGWGIGDRGKDDVIYNTPTPYWDELLKTYPNSQLQASGENVGLPDGQMGNSELATLISVPAASFTRTW